MKGATLFKVLSAARAGDGRSAGIEELLAMRGEAARLGLIRTHRSRTGDQGLKPARLRGRGMEFAEVRQYQPGDDSRNIDWRVTARRGKPHTKVFHEERDRSVILVLDAREPMRFATHGAYKVVVGARLAALMAWAAHLAGDRVGLLAFAEDAQVELPPSHDRRKLLLLMQGLAEATRLPAHEPHMPVTLDLATIARRLDRITRPGTLTVILSDLGDLDDTAALRLRRIARHGDVLAVAVRDRLEEEPPPPGHYTVGDGRGRRIHLDADDPVWREGYIRAFREQRNRLLTLCGRHGLRFLSVRCDEDPVVALSQRLTFPGAA